MKESEQDETKASYCRKLKKSDGQLNFSLPAEILDNQVRHSVHGLVPFLILKAKDCVLASLAAVFIILAHLERFSKVKMIGC